MGGEKEISCIIRQRVGERKSPPSGIVLEETLPVHECFNTSWYFVLPGAWYTGSKAA